jgi:hypothetical protein
MSNYNIHPMYRFFDCYFKSLKDIDPIELQEWSHKETPQLRFIIVEEDVYDNNVALYPETIDYVAKDMTEARRVLKEEYL